MSDLAALYSQISADLWVEGHDARERRARAFAALYEQGYNYREIGQVSNLSHERVRQIIGTKLSKEKIKRIQKERHRITVACELCGFEFKTMKGRPRKRCLREPECEQERDPKRWINPQDGHQWVLDPMTKKVMRAQRFLVQRWLGRPLKRNEWVVLLDGDVYNLDRENIAIMTPKEALRHGRLLRDRGVRRG